MTMCIAVLADGGRYHSPMSSVLPAAHGATPSAAERLAAAIERDGYGVEPSFVQSADIARLRARALTLDANARLRAGGVGRGGQRAVNSVIRGDRIAWLEESSATPVEERLRLALEELRLAMNRHLALGLFQFEGHYALYPTGAGYARHRDRFRDDDSRILSCVLYLNDTWSSADGGALRLHLAHGATHDIVPHGGTLVAFLSERFEHEVLPATRARVSLAGWFRRRTL
jgi:SM-20-related protein